MASPGSGSDAAPLSARVSFAVPLCSLISSHPHGSRQRSCHWFCCTQFLQAFRSNIFPLRLELSRASSVWGHLWILGSFQRGLDPLGHCFSCIEFSICSCGAAHQGLGEFSSEQPHHTRDWASFYSIWISTMLKSDCISPGVNGKCMSSEVQQKITFFNGFAF